MLMKLIPAGLLSLLLLPYLSVFAAEPQPFGNVQCEGSYPHHLQGVCTNQRDAIYWSFTDFLVKTNATGKVLKKIAVGIHHGDLCFYDGKIFVAVNFGRFNDAQKRADSWVYVYDTRDLALLAKHHTPQLVYGAGGIAYHNGRFMVVGGLPPGIQQNYLYQYDENFKFVKRHSLKSGYTLMGIQTAEYADGYWWLGCYGTPKILLKVSDSLGTYPAEKVERFQFDGSLGMVRVGKNQFLVAKGPCSKQHGCRGSLHLAAVDSQHGLAFRQAE